MKLTIKVNNESLCILNYNAYSKSNQQCSMAKNIKTQDNEQISLKKKKLITKSHKKLYKVL